MRNVIPSKEKFMKYLEALGFDLNQKQVYQKIDMTGQYPLNNGVEYLNAEDAWSKLSRLNENGVCDSPS